MLKVFVSIIALILFSLASFSQVDCDSFKEGTFVYLNTDDETIFVEIKGKEHTEYYDEGKSYIRSKIKWKKGCQYTLKLQAYNLQGFSGKKGDKISFQVVKIIDQKIISNASTKERKWKSVMLQIEGFPEEIRKNIK